MRRTFMMSSLAVYVCGMPCALSADDNSLNNHLGASGYIGVQTGIGRNSTSVSGGSDYNALGSPKWGTHSATPLLGIKAGVESKKGSLIFGIESNFLWLGTFTKQLDPTNKPLRDTYLRFGNSFMVAATPRIGYEIGQFSLYGKAGIAALAGEARITDTCVSAGCGPLKIQAKSDSISIHPIVGLTAEMKITKNTSVYLSADHIFPSKRNISGIDSLNINRKWTERSTLNIGSIGLMYRF